MNTTAFHDELTKIAEEERRMPTKGQRTFALAALPIGTVAGIIGGGLLTAAMARIGNRALGKLMNAPHFSSALQPRFGAGGAVMGAAAGLMGTAFALPENKGRQFTKLEHRIQDIYDKQEKIIEADDFDPWEEKTETQLDLLDDKIEKLMERGDPQLGGLKPFSWGAIDYKAKKAAAIEPEPKDKGVSKAPLVIGGLVGAGAGAAAGQIGGDMMSVYRLLSGKGGTSAFVEKMLGSQNLSFRPKHLLAGGLIGGALSVALLSTATKKAAAIEPEDRPLYRKLMEWGVPIGGIGGVLGGGVLGAWAGGRGGRELGSVLGAMGGGLVGEVGGHAAEAIEMARTLKDRKDLAAKR